MRPNGRLISLCSFTQFIMLYQIQFWFGGSVSEWRGCGEPLFKTEEAARTRIRALREQSDGYVQFRVQIV